MFSRHIGPAAACLWMLAAFVTPPAVSAQRMEPPPFAVDPTHEITRLQNGREAVADRLLVTLHAPPDDHQLQSLALAAGRREAGKSQPVRKIGSGATLVVDVSGASSLESAIQALAADPRVKAVGPDLILRSQELPNDPEFGKQWNMSKIQAPAAWNRTHGWNFRTIAILDSGINELGSNAHPDLAGKVVARRDFTGSPVGADDVFGHGTHVAGIAAAATNNAQGVAGVGYDTRLMNVKVLNDTSGEGELSWLIDGIRWAVDNGANVINMSLGAETDCDPNIFADIFDAGLNELHDALNHARAHNVVVVAGAGNHGSSAPIVPGSCPHVVAVANTTQSDIKASNSGFGSWVELAAPGTDVWSTAVPGGLSCQKDRVGAFAKCSGVSMATPHVSGLAALVQASCQPPTAQGVIDRITSTSDAIAGTGSQFQFGRINALRAVCFPKPALLKVTNVGINNVSLQWTDTTPGESFMRVRHGPVGGVQSFTTLPANTETFTHSGLTSGVTYQYSVEACDIAGCSGPTGQVTALVGSKKLSVSVAGGGSVTSSPAGISCGNGKTACSKYFPSGTVVTLTARGLVNPLKDLDWELSHWEGDCASAGSDLTCRLTMSGNRTTKAVFENLN